MTRPSAPSTCNIPTPSDHVRVGAGTKVPVIKSYEYRNSYLKGVLLIFLDDFLYFCADGLKYREMGDDAQRTTSTEESRKMVGFSDEHGPLGACGAERLGAGTRPCSQWRCTEPYLP